MFDRKATFCYFCRVQRAAGDFADGEAADRHAHAWAVRNHRKILENFELIDYPYPPASSTKNKIGLGIAAMA